MIHLKAWYGFIEVKNLIKTICFIDKLILKLTNQYLTISNEIWLYFACETRLSFFPDHFLWVCFTDKDNRHKGIYWTEYYWKAWTWKVFFVIVKNNASDTQAAVNKVKKKLSSCTSQMYTPFLHLLYTDFGICKAVTTFNAINFEAIKWSQILQALLRKNSMVGFNYN